MSSIVVEPSSTAQWHALVGEAQALCERRLDEDLESHLVFVLMRFVGRPEMAAAVLALDYLTGMESVGRIRADQLRDVGDKCLLYSGFFPQRAERRRVKLSYYIDLGRSAYLAVSEQAAPSFAEFYYHLADDFVAMRDVLQAMRELGGQDAALDPLQAMALWQESGSRRARQTLESATDATPVADPSERKH